MISSLSLANNSIQYNGNFPLPKPDLNGFCDNFSGARFMQSTTSSSPEDQNSQRCLQKFDIQNECLSVVNPAYFTSFLQVYTGQSTISDQVSINVNEVFLYDDENYNYT